MSISEETQKIRNSILEYEARIEEMHLNFQKYLAGIEKKMPEWEKLEKELLLFSRKKLIDLELSKQLDRILYKFQNRKRIWLAWIDEYQHTPSV